MRNRTILYTGSTGTIKDEIDRLFDQLVADGVERAAKQARTWSPPVDVLETDSYFWVRVEVAGMQEDDFHVIFQDNVLYIRGERHEPSGPRRLYHHMQIRYGEFLIVLRFDGEVRPEDITAEYQAGFLTVQLPKKDTHRSGSSRGELHG